MQLHYFLIRLMLCTFLVVGSIACKESETVPASWPEDLVFFPEAENEDIQEKLNLIRSSIFGSWYPGHSIKLTGETDFLGNRVPFDYLHDFTADESLLTYRGPLPYQQYIKGSDTYVKRFGVEFRAAGASEMAAARISHMILGHAWLLKDEGILWAIEESKEEPHLFFESLNGQIRGSITLDKNDFVPTRWSIYGPGRNVQIIHVDGRISEERPWFPKKIMTEDRSGQSSLMTFSGLRTSEAGIERPEGAKPRALRECPSSYHTVSIRRSNRGHILVPVSIPGLELMWFFLDTGASSSVLDQRVVDDLGLLPTGSGSMMGLGGTTETEFFLVEHFSVDSVRFEDSFFAGADLSFLDYLHRDRLGGILGYDFLARFAIEIDLDSREVLLHDPGCAESQDISWFPIEIDQGIPNIAANFEGIEGRFLVDTGDGSGYLAIHAHAVEDYALLERRQTRSVRPRGVGGDLRARRGKADSIQFNGFSNSQFEANFILDEAGSDLSDLYFGVIGLRMFRTYRIVFDYSNKRMGLAE